MSNTSFYLKSDPSINGEINLKNFNPYKPFEFSIFPYFGRAISVFDIKVDTINKFVNFQNIIRYDCSNNLIQINKDFNINNPYGNTSWTDFYTFGNTSQKPSVYFHNLYTSVINDIVNKSSSLSNPALYLMYSPINDKTIVTKIIDNDGYYTFKSDIGYINFDKNTGFPINSWDNNNNILPFNYVVYNYDGYSDINRETYNDIMSNVPDGLIFNTTYLNNSDLYIIHTDRKSEMKVHKTYKNFTGDVFYKLLIFAPTPDGTSDEGVSFIEQNGVITPHCCVNHAPSKYWNGCTYSNNKAPCAYKIYRKKTFINFKSTNTILTIEEMRYLTFSQTITKDVTYQRVNTIVDLFQIIIPNDKPTNRIFIYQSGTNKLVHITDYIPKGTTQNVTINYSQGINNITSSVIPVNPLPVPNFGYSTYIGDIGTSRKDWIRDTKCDPGTLATNVNFFKNECPVRLIDFDCKNVYQTNDVYNKIWLQEDDWWVYNLKMYLNDEGKVLTGGCTRNSTKQLECPANSKISGFKQRGDNTTLTSAGIYCASPIIPKDYNPAILWSKTPQNIIEGGQEGSRKTYVCRANDNKYWVPGKFRADTNTCYYGYNGAKSTTTDYELASAIEPLVWKDKNKVPNNKKIEAGVNQADGVISYICRFVTDGNYVPGKEVNNKCYINYDGEKYSDTYELLSRE